MTGISLYIKFCSFIYQLKNIWAVSTLLISTITLLWTLVYFHMGLFSFQLGIQPGIYHMVNPVQHLEKLPFYLAKWLYHFTIPHILIEPYGCLFILVGLKWYILLWFWLAFPYWAFPSVYWPLWTSLEKPQLLHPLLNIALIN